eukprot:TRINITY_DN13931_c0_g7_i1.p1 TRINITY_DN13931_c0_g7~~TRINITY_DN13931_c0_g7_i1.p1  ORF type:complete len:524 (+),score=138.87 TRINITY_DN13931_c0_g7_i1:92-1663(+)
MPPLRRGSSVRAPQRERSGLSQRERSGLSRGGSAAEGAPEAPESARSPTDSSWAQQGGAAHEQTWRAGLLGLPQLPEPELQPAYSVADSAGLAPAPDATMQSAAPPLEADAASAAEGGQAEPVGPPLHSPPALPLDPAEASQLPEPTPPPAPLGALREVTVRLEDPWEPLGVELDGCQVVSIFPAGAASRAGILPGCEVRSIDGREILGEADVIEALRAVRLSRRLTFTAECWEEVPPAAPTVLSAFTDRWRQSGSLRRRSASPQYDAAAAAARLAAAAAAAERPARPDEAEPKQLVRLPRSRDGGAHGPVVVAVHRQEGERRGELERWERGALLALRRWAPSEAVRRALLEAHAARRPHEAQSDDRFWETREHPAGADPECGLGPWVAAQTAPFSEAGRSAPPRPSDWDRLTKGRPAGSGQRRPPLRTPPPPGPAGGEAAAGRNPSPARSPQPDWVNPALPTQAPLPAPPVGPHEYRWPCWAISAARISTVFLAAACGASLDSAAWQRRRHVPMKHSPPGPV